MKKHARTPSKTRPPRPAKSHRTRRSTPRYVPLTPELRQRFYRLLFTWHFADRRRHQDVAVPWDALAERLQKEWATREQVFLEYERRFGDGHYDDRQRRLDETLDWLDKEIRADLPAVFNALLRARRDRGQEQRLGWEIDFRRLLLKHHRRVKGLQDQATKARQSYLQILWHEPALAVDALEDLTPVSLDIARALDELLRKLDLDPFKNVRVQGPYRRPKAGNQPEPWLQRVRDELARAGVPNDPEDQLLIAVGLLPYRPAPVV